MDLATVLLAEIASISQRRIQHLVSPVYDIGLPQKLSPHPELGSGLFMANTTAAALVSENKTQSFPASVDSMAVDTTEDHVSMGSVAAPSPSTQYRHRRDRRQQRLRRRGPASAGDGVGAAVV